MLVPLRSGAAAAAFFNEAAGGEKAEACVRTAYDVIREIFDKSPEKIPIESVVVRGLGSLCTVRSSTWKNKRSGVFRLRLRAEFAEWATKTLRADFAVALAFGGACTHEFIVPDDKWPAGVIEQIKVRTVRAWCQQARRRALP